MDNQFPSNSQTQASPVTGPKAAQPKKKVEKVVTGEVIQRKKPLGRRLRETFNAEDTKSVISHVFSENIVPGIKELVLTGVTESLERKFFGAESRGRRARAAYSPMGGGIFGAATYQAYNRMTQGLGSQQLPPDPRQKSTSLRGRASRRDIQEIILMERAEATHVLDQLIAIISQYGVASLADLWELLGTTGEFTDNKWGWSDLMGADVQRVSLEGGAHGYLLMLPPLSPIES